MSMFTHPNALFSSKIVQDKNRLSHMFQCIHPNLKAPPTRLWKLATYILTFLPPEYWIYASNDVNEKKWKTDFYQALSRDWNKPQIITVFIIKWRLLLGELQETSARLTGRWRRQVCDSRKSIKILL